MGTADKVVVVNVTIQPHEMRIVDVVRERRSSPVGIGDIVAAVVDVATRAGTRRTVGIIYARRS